MKPDREERPGRRQSGRRPVPGAWFAERVIAVKLEYGLSVDATGTGRAGGIARRRRGAAELRGRGHRVADGGRQQRRQRAPVTGPFSITVAFSEPVTGFELEDLSVGNGRASELQGSNASYTRRSRPWSRAP